MYKVFNIHGFDGTGQNSAFRALPSNIRVTSPTFNYSKYDLRLMFEKMKKEVPIGVRRIVGTSYGGFWAVILGGLFKVPVTLINPCLQPWEVLPNLDSSMKAQVQEQKQFFDAYVAGGDFSKTKIIIGTQDELFDHEKITANLEDWCESYTRVEAGHRVPTELLKGRLL